MLDFGWLKSSQTFGFNVETPAHSAEYVCGCFNSKTKTQGIFDTLYHDSLRSFAALRGLLLNSIPQIVNTKRICRLDYLLRARSPQ